MMRFVVALILAVTAGRATGEEPVSFYDRLPLNARACLAARDRGDLKAKLDRLDEQRGPKRVYRGLFESLVPFSALEWLEHFVDSLQVKEIISPEGELAFVLVDEKVAQNLGGIFDLDIVTVFSARDRERLAKSLLVAPGALTDGKIVDTGLSNKFARGIYIQDGLAYLGSCEKSLKSVLEAKPITSELTPKERRTLAESDAIWTVGPRNFARDVQQDIWRYIGLFLGADEHPHDANFGASIANAIRSLDLAIVTVRLDGGLDMRLTALFDKAEVGDFLHCLGAGSPPARLEGLPTGRLVFAQAASTNGNRSSAFLYGILAEHLRSHFSSASVINRGDQILYLGVMAEVWKHLKDTQIGFYENDRPEKHGLWSGVAVLGADDPRAFLADLRRLGRVDESGKPLDEKEEIRRWVAALSDPRGRARESAVTQLILIGPNCLPAVEVAARGADADLARRAKLVRDSIRSIEEARKRDPMSKESLEPLRPTLRFAEPSRLPDGTDVENLQIGFLRDESRVTKFLSRYYGERWDRVRFASVGKQTAFALGGDPSLLESTTKLLKEKKADRRLGPFSAEFAKLADPARQFEFHVSVERFFRVRKSYPREEFDPRKPPGFISVGVTASEGKLQIDCWSPVVELRALRILRLPPPEPR